MRIDKLSVAEEFDGERIDKYIAQSYQELTRTYLQKLLKEGLVLVNDKEVKSNYRLCVNDEIQISIPDAKEPDILPENIPLSILYEDQDLLVVNKPKGMVVHPSAGHYSGTLVNALLYHCRDNLSGINGVMRPGIVHRIDMDTTGALIVCKNDIAHFAISEQLSVHSINRKYRAIVYNNMLEDEGTVNAPIGRHPIDRKKMAINHKNGKKAITHYKVLEHLGHYAYIECSLETGRTHQIRVHMASIHHPLLGDMVYGPAKNSFHLQGQTLHAQIIGFIHPRTKEYIEIEAPLPEYFEVLLKTLRNNSK